MSCRKNAGSSSPQVPHCRLVHRESESTPPPGGSIEFTRGRASVPRSAGSTNEIFNFRPRAFSESSKALCQSLLHFFVRRLRVALPRTRDSVVQLVGMWDWCGRRDLNPQAFWAPAPKAGVFAISPLPQWLARALMNAEFASAAGHQFHGKSSMR